MDARRSARRPLSSRERRAGKDMDKKDAQSNARRRGRKPSSGAGSGASGRRKPGERDGYERDKANGAAAASAPTRDRTSMTNGGKSAKGNQRSDGKGKAKPSGGGAATGRKDARKAHQRRQKSSPRVAAAAEAAKGHVGSSAGAGSGGAAGGAGHGSLAQASTPLTAHPAIPHKNLRIIASYCPHAVSLPVMLGQFQAGVTSHRVVAPYVASAHGAAGLEGFAPDALVAEAAHLEVSEAARNADSPQLAQQQQQQQQAQPQQPRGRHGRSMSLMTNQSLENDGTFFAVMLFADISGFTQLAENAVREEVERSRRMAQSASPMGRVRSISPRAFQRSTSSVPSARPSASAGTGADRNVQAIAAEHTAQKINAVFDLLIGYVRNYGGDVIKFAGDALLVMWRPPQSSEDELFEEKKCCMTGLSAAITMVRAMKGELAKNFKLDLHCGMSAGLVREVHFGGFRNRYEYVVCGERVVEMGRAGEFAKDGQVAIHKNMFNMIEDELNSDLWICDDHGEFVLVDMHHNEKLPVLPSSDLVAELIHYVPSYMRQELEDVLKCYVPSPVIKALSVEEEGLMGSLLRVSIVFIKLESFRYQTLHDIDRAMGAFIEIQKAIYTYEGALRQLIQDDKGTVAIVAFGLPYSSHADDPLRAVLVAFAIRNKIRSLGMTCSIGVTTGDAFCGSVGSEKRCEYAIVGNVVNLSARLMGKAKGRILCDGRTRDMVNRGHQKYNVVIDFEEQRAERLKGIGMFTSYAPVLQEKALGAGIPDSPFVGDAFVKSPVFAVLKQLGVGAQLGGSVHVVEGRSGMGKTRFVQEVLALTRHLELSSLFASGSRMHIADPYYVWRHIFPVLLKSSFDAHVEEVQPRHDQDQDQDQKRSGGSSDEAGDGGHTDTAAQPPDADSDAESEHKEPESEDEDTALGDGAGDGEGDAVGPKSHRASFSLPNFRNLSEEDEIRYSLQFCGLAEAEYAIFNPLLSVKFPETDKTRSMTEAERSATLTNVLMRLLQDYANEHGHFVLVIENVQYLNSLSWNVLTTLIRKYIAAIPVIIVMTTRADSGPAHGDDDGRAGESLVHRMFDILKCECSTYMLLEELTMQDVEELCLDKFPFLLQGELLTKRLSSYVHRLSEHGNPLFVHELLRSYSEYLDTDVPSSVDGQSDVSNTRKRMRRRRGGRRRKHEKKQASRDGSVPGDGSIGSRAGAYEDDDDGDADAGGDCVGVGDGDGDGDGDRDRDRDRDCGDDDDGGRDGDGEEEEEDNNNNDDDDEMMREKIRALIEDQSAEAGWDKIYSILRDRVHRMGPKAVEILKRASAVGMEFNIDLVRKIMPPKVTASEFDEAITKLNKNRIIFADPDREVGRFIHVSMHKVVYEETTGTDKSKFHEMIAALIEEENREVLLSSEREDNFPHIASTLAHHYRECGQVLRAIFFLNLAADAAFEMHYMEESMSFILQILDLSGEAVSTVWYTPQEALSACHRCEILLAPPTTYVLEQLMPLKTVQAVLQAAREEEPYIVPMMPKLEVAPSADETESRVTVALPGDPAHPDKTDPAGVEYKLHRISKVQSVNHWTVEKVPLEETPRSNL